MWIAEKIWGDQVFAWIRPMIPPDLTSLEGILRFVWIWGIPLGLIALGAYFFRRRSSDLPPLPPASQEPPAQISPDMRLHEFVEKRIESEMFAHFKEGNISKIGALLTDIREKARLGQITIWGRKNCPKGQTNIPRSAIPADSWDALYIDLLDYLEDRPTGAGQAKSGSIIMQQQYRYSDIWLNKWQTNQVYGLLPESHDEPS